MTFFFRFYSFFPFSSFFIPTCGILVAVVIIYEFSRLLLVVVVVVVVVHNSGAAADRYDSSSSAGYDLSESCIGNGSNVLFCVRLFRVVSGGGLKREYMPL